MIRRHLNALRKELRGSYKLIAQKAGVTETYVSLVLNGHNKSQKVLDAAIAIRDKNRLELQEVEQKTIERIKA